MTNKEKQNVVSAFDADQIVYQNASTDADRPKVMLGLLKANPQWTQEERNDFILDFWNHCNHTTSVADVWMDIFNTYLEIDPDYMQPTHNVDENWDPIEDAFDDDGTITLFRGGTTPNGFSWTTNFEIAQKFAKRNSDQFFSHDIDDETFSTIWQASVKREHILFVNNGRSEQEVVVDFNHLDDWTRKPIDWLEHYWTKMLFQGKEIPAEAVKRWKLPTTKFSGEELRKMRHLKYWAQEA